MYAYSLSVVMFTLYMYWSVELCGTTGTQVEMAEGDWDEVTVIRKRAPKAGQLKTPQVTHLLQYCCRAVPSIGTQASQSYWLAPAQKCSTLFLNSSTGENFFRNCAYVSCSFYPRFCNLQPYLIRMFKHFWYYFELF